MLETDAAGAEEDAAVKRVLCVLSLAALVTSCQADRPTVPKAQGDISAARGADLSAGTSLPSSCDSCIVGPIDVVRSKGVPESDTIKFTVTQGTRYVVELRDLGSQGSDGSVDLNGARIMSPRAGGEVGARFFSRAFTLPRENTIVARLTGKPGSLLRLTVWPVKQVSLDSVTLAPGSTLELGGPRVDFNSTITNHTGASQSNIAVQVLVRQGAHGTASGRRFVECGADFGVLPPGTCLAIGDSVTVMDPIASGLIPGSATAVIQVVQIGTAKVLDSLLVPIVLTPTIPRVVDVTVLPQNQMMKPGDQRQFYANVRTTGGVSGAVSWSSSNAGLATVSATGLVTAVAPFQWSSSSVAIIARSIADPTKSDTSVVTVFHWSVTQPDVLTPVSTGAIQPPGHALSVELTASACGPTAIFMSPIARVDFIVLSSGGGVVIGQVPRTSVMLVDNGANRCWMYRMTWSPGTAFGVGPQVVTARGVNSAGETITTPVNLNVVTVSP